MSEPARNRFALDLDDLERQLRGAAQPQKPGAANDPLMELTRLVGQDDPLKELFSGRSAPAAAAPARPAVEAPAHWQAPHVEPSFRPAPAKPVSVEASQPPAEIMGALDEFEALLRRTEPARAPVAPAAPVPARQYEQPPHHEQAYPEYAEPAAAPRAYAPQGYAPQVETGPHAYVPEEPRDLDEAARHGYPVGYDHALPQDYSEQPQYAEQPQAEDEGRDYEKPRSRKGLWAAAALIAVTVAGVGLAMTFRSSRPAAGPDGQPPVISADNAPTKVAPVNPGGAEIPNQNKQIYERSADAVGAETKVVSREEQPVDVQQAARSMPSRPVSSDQAAAAMAAGEPGLIPVPPVPGLGEPRRVRTVAIRPDGTPVPPAGNGAAVAAQQPMVTGSAPVNRPAATPAADVAKVQERAAATTPQAAVTPPPAPRTRTAALDPTPPASPAATAPRTDANGGFAVQLAAPGSEAEARATFAALQRKYPGQLGGQSPIVRKTELAGGKTVYRLRVGPYSREDAATMCTALQAAGGQCFIAKN